MKGGIDLSAKIKKAAYAADIPSATADCAKAAEHRNHRSRLSATNVVVTARNTTTAESSVVTVPGESVMNDMTDTTEDSEVSRVSDDGCMVPRPRVMTRSAPTL